MHDIGLQNSKLQPCTLVHQQAEPDVGEEQCDLEWNWKHMVPNAIHGILGEYADVKRSRRNNLAGDH